MNNKRTSGKYLQFFAVAWLVTLTLLVLSFVLKVETPPVIQYLLGLILISTGAIFANGGYYYLEVESEGDLFSIKYFNLFPLGREFKALKIPGSRFHKFEIKKSVGGLFQYLFLYEQTGRGLAKYPAIGLSALSKDERKILLEFFEKTSPPTK